ncbi:MAG: hypothetical protein M3001_12305 [Staphylococcus epidermidis]|nr:hypothetical protein [Staphylococcus epidermidis]
MSNKLSAVKKFKRLISEVLYVICMRAYISLSNK